MVLLGKGLGLYLPIKLFFHYFYITMTVKWVTPWYSGIHQMDCVYYSVPALPPEYLSSLENIFVAYLFHSDDRETYKINNHKMYRALIDELLDLQTNGISICVNSEIHHIYFALGLVLGLNSILGFVESFFSNFYCRICRSPKYDK